MNYFHQACLEHALLLVTRVLLSAEHHPVGGNWETIRSPNWVQTYNVERKCQWTMLRVVTYVPVYRAQ
jgi:hypothetical protein